MTSQFRRYVAATAALVAVSCLGLFGCGDKSSPVRPIADPAPSPVSPQQLMRLFEWCYDNRNIDRYAEIFTADFRFVSSALDYRDVPWTRDDGCSKGGCSRRDYINLEVTRLTYGRNSPGKHPSGQENQTRSTSASTWPKAEDDSRGRELLVSAGPALSGRFAVGRFDSWYIDGGDQTAETRLISRDTRERRLDRGLSQDLFRTTRRVTRIT